jgi:hypothetical protein
MAKESGDMMRVTEMVVPDKSICPTVVFQPPFDFCLCTVISFCYHVGSLTFLFE